VESPSQRSRWFRRLTPPAPDIDPPSDDVPTQPPTGRPAVVLIELAAAVLDLDSLGQSGFRGGPVGRAGQAVLRTLACAGNQLNDGVQFDRVMAAAIAAGIDAGDLDHGWDDADPDGHYDNTSLGAKYRTDGFVLHLLESLRPHPDAVTAIRTLKSLGVRPVAIPFLDARRTSALLGPGLGEVVEFVDVDPVDSLPELITSIADRTGVERTDISVVTATRAVTEAAMAAGFGTVWIDREKGVRGSSYDVRTRRSLSYRWGSTPPVPAIADDFGATLPLLGWRSD